MTEELSLGKKKNKLSRLERFPDSLSLEAIEDLANKLAKLSNNQEFLRNYLNFVRRFVRTTRDGYVKANLRLVSSVIQNQFYIRLKSKGITIEDATQEGSMSLITAAFLFDPARGYTFSTYATWWIQCFLRKLLSKAHLIHIPPYLNKTHQTKPPKSLPSYLKRKAEAQRAKKIKSINSSFETNGRKTRDLQVPDAEQLAREISIDDRLDITELLTYLPPIEKRIIELRYINGYTLEETTRILYKEGLMDIKVTKERIRQRELRAIEYLKDQFNPSPPDQLSIDEVA